MKKIAFAAIFATAALVATASAPAVAAGRDPDPKPEAKATPQPAMNKRYCMVDTFTGSRVPHKTCQTRAEWIAETGQDPAKIK